MPVAKSVIQYADDFIKGEVMLGKDPFIPYPLPGQAAGDPTAKDNTIIPPPPAKDEPNAERCQRNGR
jgi:hypothetical protein